MCVKAVKADEGENLCFAFTALPYVQVVSALGGSTECRKVYYWLKRCSESDLRTFVHSPHHFGSQRIKENMVETLYYFDSVIGLPYDQVASFFA